MLMLKSFFGIKSYNKVFKADNGTMPVCGLKGMLCGRPTGAHGGKKEKYSLQKKVIKKLIEL